MNTTEKCKVKIVGATGYTGGELIRLLLKHPKVEISELTAAGLENQSQPVHKYWSWLRNVCYLTVSEETPGEGGDAQIIFLSTPHGVSMKLAPLYLNKGYKVIDLSADYRFENPDEREGWYDFPHTSEELCEQAVYGMPELFREKIKNATLIANPGCYPTASILGLYPAIKNGFIDPSGIRINAASGVTGAGKNARLIFHHPELDQNYFAYRIGQHQHAPEIVSILKRITKKEVQATFVPHVLPIQRGILSTIYCNNTNKGTLEEIWKSYQETYKDEPFIRLYDLGEAPNLQAVCESNFVDISLHQDKITGDIVIVSAEDNLTKGAAGQAVQNLNIMMGYPEGMSLLP